MLVKFRFTPKKLKIEIATMYKDLHWSGMYRIVNATIIQISICTFYALLNPIFSNTVGIISYLLALCSLGHIVMISKNYLNVLKKI